jgi:hypothetical protein
MKFKLSVEFLIVVVLFISIMCVSSYGSTKLTPFQYSNSSLSMYPYREGAETLEGNGVSDGASISSDKKKESDVTDPKLESLLKTLSADPSASKSTETNTESFATLASYSSKYGSEMPIDPISQLSSSTNCLGKSSGLSTSTGGICITPEINHLLKTRGNNSTGQPSQIGA